MIEVPSAALQAGEVAKNAEFFSFGTNDLTQMALGLSRDDSSKFLETYIQAGIYPADPFSSIDVDGVGLLVKLAAEQGPWRRVPTSSSASAASMAAIPRASHFATRSALTTFPAPPTASPSPA